VNPFSISDNWPRAFGMAITPTGVAAVWGACDEGGTIYLYSEHVFPHAEPSHNARAIQALGDWVPGVIELSALKGSQVEKNRIAQLYRDFGLKTWAAEGPRKKLVPRKPRCSALHSKTYLSGSAIRADADAGFVHVCSIPSSAGPLLHLRIP
jgi:hypothetical protein